MKVAYSRLRVISRDHDIVGHSEDLLSPTPDGLATLDALSVPVETDFNGDIRARKLPGVRVVQPWVGRFELRTIGSDQLLEDTVLVAQSVAPHGELSARAGVKVAGGKTSKTTVSESRVALGF